MPACVSVYIYIYILEQDLTLNNPYLIKHNQTKSSILFFVHNVSARCLPAFFL